MTARRSRKAPVTQAAYERALRAWVRAGSPGRGVEIAPDGTVRVLAGLPDEAVASPSVGGDGGNSCDEALGL
jgi:hypothetical protein